MAGSKHDRSGGTEGTGEVSPLAAQLQQAWLQTQMPKVQKRSFTSAANTSNQPSLSKHQPSLSSPSGLGAEAPKPSALSALKSLSALFPELANIPEEEKPMIHSVFRDGEQQVPMNETCRLKKAECLEIMFDDFSLRDDRQSSVLSKFNHPCQTNRSFSASLVQQSSGSSDFSGHGNFSTSHSFSGSSHQSSTENFGNAFFDVPSVQKEAPLASLADLDAEVALDKAPMMSYLSDILMDENVEEKKCMFAELSAYQAMAKELGDLISDDSPPLSASDRRPSEFQQNSGDDDVGLVDSWIDEILSGPLPAELRDGQDIKVDSDHKRMNSPEEICSYTESGLCPSTTWGDGKDTESEITDTRSLYPWLDGSVSTLDSENSSHGRDENGSDVYAETKPVMPSSNGNTVHVPPVDLTNLLIRCAQAVEQADFEYANELIGEIRQHSSQYGNGPQRMAHYFMEALTTYDHSFETYSLGCVDPHRVDVVVVKLESREFSTLRRVCEDVARMSGTGGQLYSALTNSRPSEGQMLKAFRLFCDNCPFMQASHLFANYSIVEAFKGASRVHIVDYGILYGVQWPCLLHQLALRPGGPPHLRITGIDRPQPGFRPSARIQETGRRLARFAKELGIPFEFHAIAEKWEAINPAHLFLREDEVLAVNCMFRLRHLLDESVTAASPRDLVLNKIRSMQPKVFTQGVLNAGYNAPFFMSRFKEALAYFGAKFDLMETVFPMDHPDRQIIDQDLIGRDILNVVACEGLERVERTEPYRQWQARTLRAGFQQKPIVPELINKITSFMKIYHRNYGMGQDGSWFLLGWKDRIMNATTVWEPISDSP